jgi:hypothetical protein
MFLSHQRTLKLRRASWKINGSRSLSGGKGKKLKELRSLKKEWEQGLSRYLSKRLILILPQRHIAKKKIACQSQQALKTLIWELSKYNNSRLGRKLLQKCSCSIHPSPKYRLQLLKTSN